MEGRGGRRRSRSFAGPGSPRASAASPSQHLGSSSAAPPGSGKRKRSLSNAASPGAGLDSSEPAGMSAAGAAAGGAASAAAAPEEEAEEEAEDTVERERKVAEEHEAVLLTARPALIFCRVVDALQSALKSGRNATAEGGTAAAGEGEGDGGDGQQHGTLELFLSGGDEFLLAASREAHEAFESAIRPLGSGGGVVASLEAMGLRDAFAAGIGLEEERRERGEKEVAAACRERVMNLLCEGELFVVSGSRSSSS